MSFSIRGTVTDAGSGQPASGVNLRLVAAQDVLGDVAGAAADGQDYTWSQVIDGAEVPDSAAGRFRDAAYEQFVAGDVPAAMLSRMDFYAAVEDWNPALADSGHLFQPGQFYFLPTTQDGPEYALNTTTDGNGGYSFDGLQTAGVYGLIVSMAGMSSYSAAQIYAAMVANDGATFNWPPLRVTMPAPPPPEDALFTMHTLEQNLTPAQRRFVECAINMAASNERDAYDFLATLHSPLNPNLNLQTLTNGWAFRHNPNHKYYKDIDCADLASASYGYAFGYAPTWKVTDPTGAGFTGPSAANFYNPANLSSGLGSVLAVSDRLHSLPLDDDWRPGDLIVHWPDDSDDAQSIPEHVNMYVGSFNGTDREGNRRDATGERMVVNTSLDTGDPSDIWGPQDAILYLSDVVKRGGSGFARHQHVRITDLFR